MAYPDPGDQDRREDGVDEEMPRKAECQQVAGFGPCRNAALPIIPGL